MIEIIKHGGVWFNKKCRNCGCEFRFLDVDAKRARFSNQYSITCPECNNIISLKKYSEFNDWMFNKKKNGKTK